MVSNKSIKFKIFDFIDLTKVVLQTTKCHKFT